MFKGIVISVFFALALCCPGELLANTNNGLNNNNGTKEQADVSSKENSGKYSFTLFNFFNSQPKAADDSTAVKKQDPLGGQKSGKIN